MNGDRGPLGGGPGKGPGAASEDDLGRDRADRRERRDRRGGAAADRGAGASVENRPGAAVDARPGAAIDDRPGAGIRPRLAAPGQTLGSVTRQISGIVLERPQPRSWMAGAAIAFLGTLLLLVAVTYLFTRGIGIWGVNIPVAWGFAIVNFVWWIGIGHAGTFISAILVLVRQDWRTSINRFAEAMTLFAVACAGMYPILHLGRPEMFYYILPYPNTMDLWPQFRSPLTWDVFAILTYFTVSLLFWYVGLLPDLATMRDRARRGANRILFGLLSLGWRGSARHWYRYRMAYLLLAGLATPLVLSVHSIVGLDFSISIVPGWHTTIFPPYFVAGAIFSGFAMVLVLVIPVRRLYGLQNMVTMRHFDYAAKLMLATGLLTGYGYANEAFFAWYSGSDYEMTMMMGRFAGPYAHLFWILIACNVLAIQPLWFRRVRQSLPALFGISLLVLVGMWLERYVIVIQSLHRDYLPSSWDMYHGTFWDWATFAGTIGFFLLCMFLFIRFVPMIAMFEMRELVHEEAGGHEREVGEEPEAAPFGEQETPV